MGVELSINCRSNRYKGWLIYDAIMIVIWPAGGTGGLAVLLGKNRKQGNPSLVGEQNLGPELSADDDELFRPDDKEKVRLDRHSVAIKHVLFYLMVNQLS